MAKQKKQEENSERIEPFIDPELLADNSDISEQQSIRYYFNDEEMNEKKEEFFKVNLWKSKRDGILKKIKLLIESGVDALELRVELESINLSDIGDKSKKVLDAQHKYLLWLMAGKYEDRNEYMYGIAHYGLGRMAFYRSDGHFQYDRPLRPEERQKTILSLK